METRMNVNAIKVSGLYPSNLVQPIRVNGGVFKRDRKIGPALDREEEEELRKKDEKIERLRNEMKMIKSNPVSKLSAEHDDFSYIPRLVPLYRSHLSKNL